MVPTVMRTLTAPAAVDRDVTPVTE